MFVTVCFDATSGEKDNNLKRIAQMFGGKTGNSGVCFVGPHAGQRDVECEISDDKQVACLAELRKSGFEVEETERF
jgi:hypothetical protein